MIIFKHHGSFKNTERFLSMATRIRYSNILNTYGQEGVRALAAYTPVDSGETAASWSYDIHISKGSLSISWTNSNIKDGIPIAILIQYGHGTRSGSYVQGRDFINPALKPIFDRIADAVWQEVKML